MKHNKFIVVIPVYNAEKYIEKCIDSILDQEYDNFNFVVIDDCSTDNTTKILQNLHKEYIFDLIINDKRNGSPLENIIKGIKHLSTDKEDIIVTVDGDDWLYDNTVLSYLNSVYQDENIWMTYGQYEPLSKINNYYNYIYYCRPIFDTKTYRKSGTWLASHLRTFKRKLWDKINDDDLRDKNKNYYKMGSDTAWMYPIIEMSGHRHMKFISKFLYVYNDLNYLQEMKINEEEQLKTHKTIINKNIYKELNEL
jgi:glycosyltransferase involved in cell wall biosynthesis